MAPNPGKSGRRKLCIVDFDGDGRRDLLASLAMGAAAVVVLAAPLLLPF